MNTTNAVYTQKYGQLFFAFVAISALVSLVFFGSILATEYAPLKNDELSSIATVEHVTYGTTVESATSEPARNPEFQNCFVKLSNGNVLTQPQLGCTVKTGDSVTVFTKATGEERLDPHSSEGTVFALKFYVILSLSLLLGALFSLSLFTVKRMTIIKEAEDALRL